MDFKKGINIGDHFENAVKTEDFVYPIQDWYYDVIKQCGFDHIRLPVKWAYHCDADHKIHKSFSDMVQRAVKGFLHNGQRVILNIHHFEAAADNPKSQVEKLTALWEQISELFMDYPDTLIFEVMNEPTIKKERAEEWNEVQAHLVSVIRKKNPDRQIMVCGVDWCTVFAMEAMVPPKDDKNIIGTFHYYYPMEFTHQGAAWNKFYEPYRNVEWQGTKEQKNFCKNAMLVAKKWSEKYNLPVNLGEFGAYSTADEESRCRYTKFVKDTALQYGFSFTYWEFNKGFGICRTDRPELRQPLADSLIK